MRPPSGPVAGLLCLLLCSFALAPSSARAESDTSAQAAAAARSQFSAGLAHLDAHRWREAAACFESALELRASPEVRFNLSRALSEMGELTQALAQLDRIAGDPSSRKRVREAAEALTAELKLKLGRIVVEADEDDRILLVSLDGQPRGDWKLGMNVNPGAHDLKVTRVNAAAVHNSLDVKPGEVVRIRLLAPADTVAPPMVVDASAHGEKGGIL